MIIQIEIFGSYDGFMKDILEYCKIVDGKRSATWYEAQEKQRNFERCLENKNKKSLEENLVTNP